MTDTNSRPRALAPALATLVLAAGLAPAPAAANVFGQSPSWGADLAGADGLHLSAVGADLASAADLSGLMPGQLHVHGLVNLDLFLRDFPDLAYQGFLAQKMDELLSRGFPDPRKDLHHLALGAMFDSTGVSEALALGTGRGQVVPVVRKAARELGVPLQEQEIDGVTFVTGAIKGKASQFADIAPGVAFVHYDTWNEYRLSPLTLATARGQNENFYQRHQRRLDDRTYVAARLQLDEEIRDMLGGSSLEHLTHITYAAVDVVRENGRIRLDMVAQATGSVKATVAKFLIDRTLSSLKDRYEVPEVRRLLDATQVEREGENLYLWAEASAAEFQAGVVALEALILEFFQERRPGVAD